MNNLYKLFTIAFILIIPSTPNLLAQETGSQAAGLSEQRLQRYESFLQSEFDEGKIPGAVTFVMRRGHVAHNKAFGYSDLNAKTPMQSDQIFYIQSMTKPVISVAFMMLYEEGYFSLTDPVSMYLPEFEHLKVAKDVNEGASGATEPIEQEVTIAQLLSHTAGLSHGLGSSQLDQDVVQALYYQPYPDIASRVNKLTELPLVGQPGAQWYYSASPDVLALLIEKFSGMTAEEFLQKRLFDPLGMKDTGYNVPKEQLSRVSRVHAFSEDGKLENRKNQTRREGNTIFGGTHGLFSTANDYMTFCQMLMNDGEWKGTRYLSRKTVELMTVNHVGELRGDDGHGFGLGFGVLTDLAKSEMLGSEGEFYWSGAFCTFFFVDPQEELISILMMQMSPYNNFYGDKMRQMVYQAIDD